MAKMSVLGNGQFKAKEDLPQVLQNPTDLGDGDATVPKVSVIPIERSRDLDNFFIAEHHGALHNHDQILENLLNFQKQRQLIQNPIG